MKDDPALTREHARLQAVLDKAEILEVLTIALCARDTPDWDRLVQCFHPDARVTTSWFDGTAREFAVQSKRMMEGHHPSDTQRHMMANPVVTLKGGRAVVEFYLTLYQGRTLDGYEFDLQTWSVSLNFFQRHEGSWRIMRRMNIYEKERMDPHTPGSVPQSYFDGLDLSRYPQAVKFHCYRNERSSGHAPKNLILKGSPQEAAARKEAEAWLAGA
jgi:hypothetical protein